MTRKHFIALAATVKGADMTAEARRALAESHADMCAASNPHFDRTRFLEACGVNPFAAGSTWTNDAVRSAGAPEVKRITRLERLSSSVNGNPRFRVGFDDASSAITSSDAAFCYGIENPEMRGDVVVTYTRAGRIADIRPA